MTCLTTGSLHYVIPMGISAAASTRIANELGAGNPEVARMAVFAGVARGSGWQNIGAWENVVAYYLIGGPGYGSVWSLGLRLKESYWL
ncbi:unnamed protein product [Thlaspi arvense]|uniref:Uncharacterized protein n=1 Tax=Thlaspi arvense TaxID=13288 RepID=A0AAU9S122_THLAR|nr:unnamed protein product [Thlaspi arvense]